MYARGYGANERWRAQMATIAEQGVGEQRLDLRESGTPTVGFPDAEHRKRVEEASVTAASDFLQRNGYAIEDRQKANCGYDLIALRPQQPKELHVEVKGTSTSVPHFFMTENERNYMQNPKWRLALVTNALDQPKVEILDASKTSQRFDFSPLAWDVKLKN